jgi:hypothetical protein
MIGTIQVRVHYNEEAASSSAAWKGGLCRCIVSCNPINHVTEKMYTYLDRAYHIYMCVISNIF